jgi:hypothetical protein
VSFVATDDLIVCGHPVAAGEAIPDGPFLFNGRERVVDTDRLVRLGLAKPAGEPKPRKTRKPADAEPAQVVTNDE